jgi:pimeloyl-ACP methyl ester carboxylesterase
MRTGEAELIYVESGSIVLACERWIGVRSDLLPVVLLHGGGQTRHSWGATAKRLNATGRTVFALDTRGHGDSGWDPSGDYSLEALATDLITFLKDLGEPVVLVGASLGGFTSMLVTADRPDLVGGLALVDVVVAVEPQGVDRIHRFMTAHGEGFDSLEEVADAIADYNPHRRRPRNLAGLRKNVRRRSNGRWYWHWDPAFIKTVDEPQRKIDQVLLAERVSGIRVPTLVVRGLMSDVVSDVGVHHMLELMPQAKVVDVAAAGHMVAGDDNDVFGTGLGRFVDEIGPPQKTSPLMPRPKR